MKQFTKKISLIGDGGAGKTSLIRRFVTSEFDDKYVHTIGVNVKKKTVQFPQADTEMNLMIWDLQGQRNDAYIFSHMYKTEGAFVVCDITRDETFNAIPIWAQLLERELKMKVPLIILANKADLKHEALVTEDQLKFMGTKLNSPFIYTSAKTGHNVELAFNYLAKWMAGIK